MIKVLIVSVGKIYGGIEKYTLDLIKELPSSEYEIHIAVREDGELVKSLNCEHILKLNLSKKKFISSMKKIKKYVQENEINIIHCNSNNALMVSFLVKKNVKKIAAIHGDVVIDQMAKGRLANYLYKTLETKLIKRCNGCIAVSESLKNVLISRGIKEEYIKVVYNGVVPMEYKHEPYYDEKCLKICTVGNLLPSKSQITLLQAINKLGKDCPEIQLLCDIYGEGHKRKELQEYIDNNGLNNISLKGFKNNAREILNEYAIYVQPSLYESFGIAVIEAMNAGCCVIASDVGGMKEIVDNENGFLFKANDYVGLAEIIKKCYKDREIIKDRAQVGKEMVYSKFTIKQMAKNTRNCYEDIK